MSDWREDWLPYGNQYADLLKTSVMKLMWDNGPTLDPNEIMPQAHAMTASLIEKFRRLGDTQPTNGHVYRSTDRVSSSGFYESTAHLDGMGVTHRVNLDETRDNAGVGIGKYLWNGQIDDGLKRRPDWFSNVAEFFLPDFDADPNARIHVNCAAGASRAPSMAYFLVRATTKRSVLESKATVYAANSVNNRNIAINYWQDAERTLHRLGIVNDAWVLD